MAFVDRVVEYPNRYYLEDENGVQTGPYNLLRAEGTVTTAGTLLNAANLTSNVQEIATALLPEIVTDTASTGSIGANAYKNAAVTLTPPTGKTLVGVAGIHMGGTNSSYCQIIGFYVNGNAIQVQMKNTYSGSVTWSIEASGLFV